MIHLYKHHVVKFIISLTSFIQIFVYYFLEMSLIKFISTTFVRFFFLFIIIVKFFIALAFLQKKKKNILQDKKNAFLLYKNYDIEN